MKFTQLTANDFGRYLCKAVNAFGEAKTMTILEALQPSTISMESTPIFDKRSRATVSVTDGDMATLTATLIQGMRLF